MRDKAMFDKLDSAAQLQLQFILQCGALGLLTMVIIGFPFLLRWLLNKLEDIVVRLLGTFQNELKFEREHGSRKTDQVVNAIDKQTASINSRLDGQTAAVNGLAVGLASFCRGQQQHAASDNGR
jgi:hypothetical protein